MKGALLTPWAALGGAVVLNQAADILQWLECSAYINFFANNYRQLTNLTF